MAAPKAFFIAGTDTGVGKTVVACALLEKARQQGMTTAAIKPVAAGCELTEEGLRNEDALLLQASSTLQLAYAEINPVALAPAVAPHLAADMAGKRIQLDRLAGYCRGVLSRKADFTVVEGAGGWRVPVNSHEYLSGLPAMLGLPVILVVAMRLGCLNHALLTVESIRNDGLPLAGWVANQADQTPMDLMTENLSALQQR
ncbi:MAG: dethiobiotin synthase, partial [Pseudomonadales bacterium]|nr:dethiobiotin synthase [Pseudomonadales bacterium]